MPVRIGDVAEVTMGALTRYGAVTKNGKSEAVEGLVLGLRGANAQDVVKNVRAKTGRDSTLFAKRSEYQCILRPRKLS